MTNISIRVGYQGHLLLWCQSVSLRSSRTRLCFDTFCFLGFFCLNATRQERSIPRKEMTEVRRLGVRQDRAMQLPECFEA